jgi:predicted phosphodiesterase
MTRGLFIGDVHAKVEDLDDCEALLQRIIEVQEKEKPEFTVFLGDLYDAFAVKNVVVERWWIRAFERLHSGIYGTYLVLGNHDRPGDQSAVGNALQGHRGQSNVHVVDREEWVPAAGIVLLPFHFKAEDFVAACKGETAVKYSTVVCHQSFIGGKYESGQPIEARHDACAVDAAVLPQKCVISGHIHTPQTTGKVWYVGAPRWRNNVSDANVDRHIAVVDFEGGVPKAIRKYETGDVCKRIWKMDLTEGAFDTQVLPGKDGDRYVADITGSAAYIEAVKKDLVRPGVRIRTFQTDRAGPKLSEADGVPAAWGKWATGYVPKFGTTTEALADMARERLAL